MAQLVKKQTTFMETQTQKNKNLEASIRNLEVQIGQIAQAVSARQIESLPSDTQNNPKDQSKEVVNAVTQNRERTTRRTTWKGKI